LGRGSGFGASDNDDAGNLPQVAVQLRSATLAKGDDGWDECYAVHFRHADGRAKGVYS
jgi:hypothetical protein